MAKHLTRTSRRAAATAALALTAFLGGCDSWFESRTDDIIDPNKLTGPAALPLLRDGARADFSLAYGGNFGGTEGIALASGLLADEYYNGDTFPTRREIDQRAIKIINPSLSTLFRNMHRARGAALRTINLYTSLNANTAADQDGLSEMYSLVGFMSVFFAETYCSGVPLSVIDPETRLPVYGQPLTTTQQLDSAIARFDQALALTPATASFTQLARLGKARALLAKGDVAGAAALVTPANVPTNFRYAMAHATANNGVSNPIFGVVNTNRRYSVAPGTNPAGAIGVIDFSASDPRAPVARGTGSGALGQDGTTPQWNQLIWTTREASFPVATGVEARLIEAEALLQSNPTAWLAALNALRATVPGLTPLADPGTLRGRVLLHFRERAFWLFSTAHRLGDLRRMIRQYGFTATELFPSGEYFKGGQYGTDVNIPLPNDEQNNPNVPQGALSCIDRNA